MSNRNGRKPQAAWLQQQAQQQRAAQEKKMARQTEQQANEAQAKEFLTKLVQQVVAQQNKISRLAPAFADRCWRVHELYGQLRVEWERAEAAEAKVKELEARLAAQGKNRKKETIAV